MNLSQIFNNPMSPFLFVKCSNVPLGTHTLFAHAWNSYPFTPFLRMPMYADVSPVYRHIWHRLVHIHMYRLMHSTTLQLWGECKHYLRRDKDPDGQHPPAPRVWPADEPVDALLEDVQDARLLAGNLRLDALHQAGRVEGGDDGRANCLATATTMVDI